MLLFTRTEPVRPYKSDRTLALVLRLFLAATIEVSLLRIALSALIILGVVWSASDGPPFTEDVNEFLAGCASLLSIIQTIFYFCFTITFIVWFRRLRINLDHCGVTNLGCYATDCVTAVIVPIVNFYRPATLAQKFWKCTTPAAFGENWKTTRGTALIAWWWGTNWLASIAAVVESKLENFDVTPTSEQLKTMYAAAMAADATVVVTTFLAIVLVHQLSARVVAKYNRFHESTGRQ